MEDFEKRTKFPVQIMCLDDEPSVLRALVRLLRHHKLQAVPFTEGAEALAALEKQDFALIISDMRMPNMNGAEFLEKAKVIAPDTQRILLTGYSDLISTVNAVNQGEIHAYVKKPWQNQRLIYLIEQAIEKYRLKKHNLTLQKQIVEQNSKLKELNDSLELLVDKRTKQIRQVLKQLEVANEHERTDHKATVELLYNFINANPNLDAQLAKNIATTCLHIAQFLKLSDKLIEMANMAGYLAQVGLLAMDPALYKVPPTELNEKQRKLFYTHPATAQLMLMPAQHLSEVAEAIYHQFEKYNGNGIPKGLKGSDIPICAHILSVARDYWQNISLSQKPQEQRYTDALELIKMYSGNFYHPKVVSALEATLKDKKNTQSDTVKSMDILTSKQLKPGMILGLAIHSHKGIMLLPKGHQFTEKSINKLQQLETQKPTPFRIMIKDD
ncbi:HD domain-containing phosphohydrolase [Pseudoalteromonas sp. MMG012]|uniref:HD domain-containing phosphohydrolase n=1 Tax=Pseudoalteromonas sp. MMG012 TaxID=2822686 RepID=UPI001B3A4589|nr:HD domain-containing phosphohydrolase [Pseudoalteromonas sp. MMG012]MBQ4850193.1 response regulator [Pseudoalteromonas sp. MMG012]